jgi:hypothetical protein
MSAVYDYVDVPRVQFMPKPFDLDEILHVITRVFEDPPTEEAAGTLPPVRTSERPRP